jgi:Excreted virulence factor EspC, type VII ESX diderm
VSEGFSVDLDTLHGASQQVREGADAIGEAAALLDLLRLDAQALGEVPAAERFAAAVRAFTTAHSDDQRHGSTWVDDAAENLAGTADLYQRADEDAAGGLRKAGER